MSPLIVTFGEGAWARAGGARIPTMATTHATAQNVRFITSSSCSSGCVQTTTAKPCASDFANACDLRGRARAATDRARAPRPADQNKRGRRRVRVDSPAASRGRVSRYYDSGRLPKSAAEELEEVAIDFFDELDAGETALSHRQLDPAESLRLEAREYPQDERGLLLGDALRHTEL